MNRQLSRLRSPHLIGVALLVSLGHCDAAPQVVLQNSQIAIEVDPGSGAITRIQDRSSGISLAPPEGTAENFRLVLLTPEKKTLTILGKDQKLTGSDVDGDKVSLSWAGPLADTAGTKHDVSARMDITASGSSLEFTLHAANNTEYRMQEAWYPLIGGSPKFAAPGKECDATLWAPTTTPLEKPVKLPFEPVAVAYPSQVNMSFTCVQSKSLGKSIYLASHDEIARLKFYHLMEVSGPAGKDVFACIQHMPFTPPGKTFDGSPVVLRFVDGDWRAAGQVYREWFKSAFGISQPSDCWIRRQSFFLFTMFMLPEGTINYTFKDIPKWAKAAKEHGIDAVQISGWQMGGHDNGYPDYTIDPRLGTWEDLQNGIRACHKMGLKVFFFVNYQPMMLESDWYKNDLHKYREMTADGGLTWNEGWGMGTLWARMGHPKLMTWADPAFPQFRKIIVDQFAKLAEIGGDGVHVDKMFPTAIDYNPDIPMSPDTVTWEGAILLTKEIMAACRKHNPDWAMSFETNWDRMLQFSGSTWWVGNQLITRRVFPENAETLALSQPYDYLGVNNAVRGGHHVMVAPMNFCRGVEWAPFRGLADYIKEVKRIRDSLRETVFYGEVLGETGVKLEGARDSCIQHNVFRNRDTGRRVCVVTNSSRKPGTLAVIGFDPETSGTARIHVPFRKSFVVRLPASVDVPGEGIAFIEETERGVAATRAARVPAAAPVVQLAAGAVTNGDFETGSFDGWTADANWVVVDNSRGYYSGWQGNHWAWSGGKGEAATGVLTSKPFVLDKNGVHLLISGWNSISGTGAPRKWNYVTLNLEEDASASPLRSDTEASGGAGDSFARSDIFRMFANSSPFGDQGPEQFYAYPDAQPEPWVGFSCPKIGASGSPRRSDTTADASGSPRRSDTEASGRGVYIGTRDPADRKLVVRLELCPGGSGTPREDGNWPRPEELRGLPAGVELSFVDFANSPAGKTYAAAPIFLRFLTGSGPEMRNTFAQWKAPKMKAE